SAAEPQNWLMYWGDYQGTHYSSLKHIDTGNVHLLRPAWSMPNPGDGGLFESTPIVVDGVIYTSAGANQKSVTAADARTGKRLWRFYTIPAAGEPGSETWKGDSFKTGGGSTWLTGTYDPELNTVYWPIANPAAMTDRSVRGEGDNLYTDCVVALDPDTGKM